MRRPLNSVWSALLTVAAVPAALAVPVAGPAGHPAHAVPPRVVSTPLSGVDASALAEAGPASGAVAGPVAAGAVAAGAVVAASVAARPAVLTAKRGTRHFDLVAITWGGTADRLRPVVRVRVREHGHWTAWQALPLDDDGADAGSAESRGARDGTSPLLTDGADGVQVRVDTPTGAAPKGLSLDLVDAGRSAADGGGSGGGSTAAAATPRPGIVTRQEWGADESLVKASPVVNRSVKTLVLHHTATTNAYSASGAYAQLRAVYAFHTKVRGWNDIGYNFLVDRYGRVYEGRRGSLTAPVMGAHTGGFNSSSLGVSVLGTFSTVAPPQAAVDAVVRVMSWQAAQYGINPRGTASVISAGGSAARYKAGTAVRVTGIVGHRDLGLTECPGNAFYPKLASIRWAVAARMTPGLVDPTLGGTPADAVTGSLTFAASVPTRQKWALTVRPLCGGAAVRTITGTAASRISGAWDLKDSDGRPVPPGAYTVTVTTHSPVGSVPAWSRDVEVLATAATAVPAADPSTGPSPTAGTAKPGATKVGATKVGTRSADLPPCPVRRVAGSDPAVTSVVAGRLAQPDARTVVLVNATGGEAPFADALAVAPLAVAQHAPLLLTGASSLPEVVARDIAARRVTTAWIVGSTSSVTPAVEAELRALGVTTVTRLAGADRWATAAAVAAQVGAPAHQAVLVPGDAGELLDALVAAASAAGSGRPVLLTSRTGVPAATLAALRSLKVTSVTVVGSTTAVPEKTLTALASAGVTTRSRLVGKGRWATAAAIATAYAPELPSDRVVLTSGLVAGPDLLLASAQGRPVLISSSDVLPTETAAWLAAHHPATVAVIANPDLVNLPVVRAAASARL